MEQSVGVFWPIEVVIVEEEVWSFFEVEALLYFANLVDSESLFWIEKKRLLLNHRYVVWNAQLFRTVKTLIRQITIRLILQQLQIQNRLRISIPLKTRVQIALVLHQFLTDTSAIFT